MTKRGWFYIWYHLEACLVNKVPAKTVSSERELIPLQIVKSLGKIRMISVLPLS